MCFGGSVTPDNSGQIASDQEAKRQATVQQDTQSVNDAFSSAFNPDYYDNITKNYEAYYNPQLDQQYQNALNTLTYQLGQQGILQSSEGDRQLALLKQSYGTNQQTVANNAANAASTAKQQVAQQQNQLLGEANSAADPLSLAAQTAAGVGAINTNPTYSPLGAVFSNLLGQGTNALSIQQGGGLYAGNGAQVGSGQIQGTGGSTFNAPLNGGSSHVVS